MKLQEAIEGIIDEKLVLGESFSHYDIIKDLRNRANNGRVTPSIVTGKQ